MHACGHDCHISMLLTAAMIVNEIRDRLKGTIVFAFQPAEELGLGARAMIEEGALEGVDACFGMHVWSDYPAGTVALRKGPMMASGDQFKIHVRGKSTHGAQPQLGADALIMGAAIAQNLQTIVSRETYPGDTAVVTVGKFHSGTRFNVVAGTAELEGTTRTFSPAVRDRFEEQITRIARSTAEAMRGTADVEYLRIVPVTVNDPGMIDVVTGAAGKIFGDKGVIEANLQMGGEDFAFYQEKVPGAIGPSRRAQRGLRRRLAAAPRLLQGRRVRPRQGRRASRSDRARLPRRRPAITPASPLSSCTAPQALRLAGLSAYFRSCLRVPRRLPYLSLASRRSPRAPR